MKQIHQNTFMGGMDTDTSVNKYENTKFLKSQNFRVLMGGEHTSGALSNVKGNKELIRFSGGRIIGLAEMSKALIVLIHHDRKTYLYDIPFKKIDEAEVTPLSISLSSNSPYYKLRQDFGFDEQTRLNVIARKETSKIRKVYFTDGENGMFAVNLEDKNINNYSVDRFRVISDVDLNSPKVVEITSGSFSAGKVQYAYQLYNRSGSETVFSPLSELVHLTRSTEGIQSREYRGTDIEENTGKGVNFKLTGLDQKFDRVRVLRIFYQEFQTEPAIQIFREIEVSENDITIIDTGIQVLEEIVAEEFNELLISPIPKAWETKNQYLFAANTREKTFDFDFNARAYRANQSGEVYESLDNPFNYISQDEDRPEEKQYKYHPTKTDINGDPILGGAGENVEYWFRTEQIELDNLESFGDPYVKNIDSKKDFSSPIIAATKASHQRDEIYRYGLVGYDETFKASFVKEIGDIRMPDISDGTETFEIEASEKLDKDRPATYNTVLSFPYFLELPDYALEIYFQRFDTTEDAILRIEFSWGGSSAQYEAVIQGNINMGEALSRFKNDFNSNPPHPDMQITNTSYATNTTGTFTVSFTEELTASEYEAYSPEHGLTGNINGAWTSNSKGLENELTNDLSFRIYFIDTDNPVARPVTAEFDPGINISDKGVEETLQAYTQIFNNYIRPLNGSVKITHISTKRRTVLGSYIGRLEVTLAFEGTKQNNFSISQFEFPNFEQHYFSGSDEKLPKPTVRTGSSSEYIAAGTEFKTIQVTNNYALTAQPPLGMGQASDTRKLYANILYPVFKVDTSKFPDHVKYYQIVRVERDRENRTVIDMGTVGHVARIAWQDGGSFVSSPIGNPDVDLNSPTDPVVTYISPEHLYNNLLGVTGDKLEIFGILDSVEIEELYPTTWLNSTGFSSLVIRSFPGDLKTSIEGTEYFPQNFNILEGGNHVYREDPEAITIFDGASYRNSSWDLGVAQLDSIQASPGSRKMLKLQGEVSHWKYYLLGRRRNLTYPYGGVNRTAIRGSVFIPSSATVSKNISIVKSSVGDTYINFFTYLKDIPLGAEYEDSVRFFSRPLWENVPVESSINLNLTSNPDINSITLGESPPIFLAAREKAGAYIYKEDIYEQDFDLYTYNSVYSQLPTLRKFFPKPLDFEPTVEWTNRVYYSDKKTAGESADSWMKFRPGNYADVDTAYGEIVELKTFKDNLFCFQPKGISILGVEQRELVQTDSPGPLVVGTGEVLTPPYYLTTNSGITDRDHVVSSRNVVYFYDSSLNKVGRIIERGVEFISDSKHISSFMEKSLGEVKLFYNPIHNEVLISTEHEGILVFNEYLDVFTGIYSTRHHKGIIANQQLLVYNRTSTNTSLYKNTDSESNTWYDSSMDESKVTIIVNPAGNFICIYDIIELTLEVLSDGDVIPNQCINSIRFYNEWQDTGVIDLEPEDNIVQRFRTWRINNMTDTTEDEARLRSSSLFIELGFDNSTGYDVILHDIITKYRTNMRFQQE